ncbi:hypothetical protein C499_04366 [Halogeometricum borinquense DSM 11551]|uniref:Predicted membrane protein n=1 Tax=Halogeometricum borinquense (strain ATCC 700274 / DSM 11551 / JCM 10706 / KCTC 4070 / PR3) TaxID=469382 RepID=E4NSH4_HALBP|nr:DUF4010 domain-containing protein [Halogeometricum borinquense]ADQ66963.1 predicted membrane protein [Halogeometricum borinquense DSM 11551]ELY30044.1 hypothetical protein C499_04366 [Halogeometricum borinquense DSM 11551]
MPLLSPLVLQGGDVLSAPLSNDVVRLVLAALLGMFLGLEREWSEKSAGIRTFALTSLVAAVFTLVASKSELGGSLLAVGAVLVVVQGILLAVHGLRQRDGTGLSLTTSVSLMAAYGVGTLVALGYALQGVTVAVVSSLLLVLKRELHGLAGRLDREEIRSTAEFAILAFVAYPILPAESYTLYGITIDDPRVAWLMVVTVAGIGIVNYAVVQQYGGRGIAVTGFFGGLASSAAVVGTMLDHVRQQPEAYRYGVAAVLLADAAMSVRNLFIAITFTATSRPLLGVVLPLGCLIVGSVAAAWFAADWSQEVTIPLESPFSLRNAFGFGFVFLVILVVGTMAQGQLGTLGLYASTFISGFVSSAGATTTAVLLYRGGTISPTAATVAILLATAASVLAKAILAVTGPSEFRRAVSIWSFGLLVAVGALTGGFVVLGIV